MSLLTVPTDAVYHDGECTVLNREGTLAGTGGWLVTLHLCGGGRRKQEGWPGSKMSRPGPSYTSPPSSLNLLKVLYSFKTATLAGD